MDQVVEVKLSWVFVAWPGILVVAAMAAVYLAAGWKSAVRYLRQLKLCFVVLWLAALLIGVLVSGSFVLAPHNVSHGMYGWDALDNLREALVNLFRVLVIVGVVTTVILGPDFLFYWSKGQAGRVFFALGVWYAFYLLAGIMHVFFWPVGRE